MSTPHIGPGGKEYWDPPLQVGDEVEYCKETEVYSPDMYNQRPITVHPMPHDPSGFGFTLPTNGYPLGIGTTRHWNILKRNGQPYTNGPMPQNFKLTGFGTAALAPPGGCVCKRCNSLNEYAVPNQKDGKSYLCYSCRV